MTGTEAGSTSTAFYTNYVSSSDNYGHQLVATQNGIRYDAISNGTVSTVWNIPYAQMCFKTISNQTTNGNGLLLLDIATASYAVIEVRPSGNLFGVPVALNDGSWYAIIQDFGGTRKTNYTLSAHVTYIHWI